MTVQRELYDPVYARTIFQRIIDREAPAYIVYECPFTIAFLDTGAIADGHTLLVPKERVATLDELSDPTAGAVGRALPRVCRAVVAATGVRDYNVIQNNGRIASQTVFHAHFHIVPKPSPDRGIAFRTVERRFDRTNAPELARRIRHELGLHDQGAGA